jgi:hypothetical protein
MRFGQAFVEKVKNELRFRVEPVPIVQAVQPLRSTPRGAVQGSTVQKFNVNRICSSRSTASLRSNRSTTEEQVPIVPMVPSLARFQR